MSHEQSETITRPSGAYNVYGGTQYPLSPVFGFERARYDSIPQAVNAAQWRSRMGGGPEGGQSPAYGFQPQPQPEYIGFINKLLDVLADPRNQWMGTGMMGGTIKGVGKLRNLFADKEAARMGGFNVPIQKMTKDMKGVSAYGESNWKPDPKPFEHLGFDPETAQEIANTPAPGIRRGYLDQLQDSNEMSRQMRLGTPLEKLQMGEAYGLFDTRLQKEISDIMGGQAALADMNKRAMTQTEGPPPEMVKRLFGY